MGIFFNHHGPTHAVSYKDNIPTAWKHFTPADVSAITEAFFRKELTSIKRLPVMYGPLVYMYYSLETHGYGIRLPKTKREIHLSKESYTVVWPELVVEYPAMRIFALKGNKVYHWDMPHVSSSGSLCMGNVFIDYHLKDVNLIYKHLEQQIYGATWADALGKVYPNKQVSNFLFKI